MSDFALTADRTALIRKRVAELKDGGPQLPPSVLPKLALPRVHHVVAWRHDGEVRKTAHETKEIAFAFARALHYAIVYKWAVMDGREMLAIENVSEPC